MQRLTQRLTGPGAFRILPASDRRPLRADGDRLDSGRPRFTCDGSLLTREGGELIRFRGNPWRDGERLTRGREGFHRLRSPARTDHEVFTRLRDDARTDRAAFTRLRGDP